ncbi:hypothetical protein MSAN_01927700 [Mycena sanguinolenta]|uniref:Zn(2)-C6 fungal-type domain-containing protein n=1 Tax=Mycena sanguinolenta TaxID=230812 RepID=A0A8H6XPY2_9AGAR|nr:hypothetical protein MSAN_01927700 [Mycena sanguinolenta]
MPSLSPRDKAKSTSTADGDHRKRRRNRTTQSCLNCHATKRMCDRKRPCSRCSQLGLTGNCVYEADDPSRSGQVSQDHETRMMSRIAELEGVIRELKNKPHPRWLAAQDRATSSDDSYSSAPSSVGPSTPQFPTWSFPASSRSSPPIFSSEEPGQFGSSISYEKDSVESFFSMYAGLSEHMFLARGGTCGCLTEGACYTAVLDLSARLRRTAEILGRSPSHANNSTCGLSARISALDTLANDSLLILPDHCPASGLGLENHASLDQSYGNNDTVFAWEMDDISGYNDLMSWVPTRM